MPLLSTFVLRKRPSSAVYSTDARAGPRTVAAQAQNAGPLQGSGGRDAGQGLGIRRLRGAAYIATRQRIALNPTAPPATIAASSVSRKGDMSTGLKSPRLSFSDPLDRAISFCRWLWIALDTVVLVSAAELFTALVPRRARPMVYTRFARAWGRLFLLGTSLSIEGADRIPRSRAVVLASNHQSAFDIPAFHALLPVRFRWVAKRDFFSWPFVGRALSRLGGIRIRPGSHADVRGAWEEAVAALAAGDNLVIFPEGTWGDREGRMLPFQRGIVGIAREANVPIIPITIVGSNTVNPPRTREIHRGAIRLTVHPPMEPAAWRGATDEEWLAALRECIGRTLERGAAPTETM